MARLTWDKTGERYFEAGIKDVALYLMWSAKYDDVTAKIQNSDYIAGVNWNGVTKVGESPEGADANDLWADDIKYASFRSAEEFNGSIEAYQYPEEFASCNGERMLGSYIKVAQQARRAFGLVYKTTIGNDVEGFELGYKLHIVYNATCSPSSRDHETINDSPDAETMSWDFETTPVEVGTHTINGHSTEFKKTSHIVLDSRDFQNDDTKLTKVLNLLYGNDSPDTPATLPTPSYLFTLLEETSGTYDVVIDPEGGTITKNDDSTTTDSVTVQYTTPTTQTGAKDIIDNDGSGLIKGITREGFELVGLIEANGTSEIAPDSIAVGTTGNKFYRAIWQA